MDKPVMRRRQAIGVMTGTSMDGADAALVSFEGSGLNLKARFEAHHFVSMGDLTDRLRAASLGVAQTAVQWGQLSQDLAKICSEAIAGVLDKQCRPDIIAVHGQTLFHVPPLSLQLLNAAPIAQQFGIPVISDLRQADLAAGGQGAPITPLADWVFFRDPNKPRLIVNLGGFVNVTSLPLASTEAMIDDIEGFDCCSCNQLLDGLARLRLNASFDLDGQAALRGRVDDTALKAAVDILCGQRRQRRSLGSGDELPLKLEQLFTHLSPDDSQATATAAVAASIAHSLQEFIGRNSTSEVLVAGGGAHNIALLQLLGEALQRPIRRTSEIGIPVEAREAAAMAALGILSSDGISISLPQITGCSQPAPLAGVWSFVSRR